MSGFSGHLDEWEQRAAPLGPAICRAFPMRLMDQECLRTLIRNASRPLTPKGGVFARFYAKIFPFAWVDSELLNFLKLLRNHTWIQIDWNRNWMVIPILPQAAFIYCLPGIMSWIVRDADAAYVAVEGLIDYSLVRILLRQDATSRGSILLNCEQRYVIAEVVRLLRDLSFADNPQLQSVAGDIILRLNDGVAPPGRR